MKNNDNLNSINDNSYAYPRQAITYGTAESYNFISPEVTPTDSLTFMGYLNYFFCEYFKGLVFVLLSSVFIFAMPKTLTGQGSLKNIVGDFMKRAMDIVGAVTGLLLTLPFWIILPILIKLDSPGPVFYTQVRVGVNRRKSSRRLLQKVGVEDNRQRDRRRDNTLGTLFSVIKFRTMVNGAEKDSGPVWATKNDARITKLGMFLRKTRLDEIPQFINVLKGEMSLVGPRPERPVFVRELSEKVPGYADRLAVKPGITGLAQVENGYDSSVTSVRRKVKYDLTYIKKKSVWTDIKILLKTVVVVFTGKGAC